MSGSKKVFTTLGSSNHVPEEREAFDYYATDPRAVEMLLELEQFSPVIWEPCRRCKHRDKFGDEPPCDECVHKNNGVEDTGVLLKTQMF